MSQTNPKQKSIEEYGDLTNRNIKVRFNKEKLEFSFQIDTKDKIYTFIGLSEQLENQGITTTDINNSNDLHKYLSVNFNKGFFNELSLKTALNNYSIATYGDLRNLNSIVVDYNGSNYTFKVGGKDSIIGLELFKTELENQRITISTISTINDIDDVTSIITESAGTLDTAKAKTKKTSIENYGDLTSQTINVSYNVEDEAIEYTVNGEKLNFAKLKEEAGKQGIILTTEEALTDNSVLGGLVTSELTKAKSIKTYGDLKDSENRINVSFVNGAIEYAINNQTPIDFVQLKKQVKNQGITTFEDSVTEATLTATHLTGLNFEQLKKAKSIKTYGDLINRKLKVSYDRNNFVFQIDEKDPITGFDNLKSEYKLQKGETNIWTYEEFSTIFNETKFKEGQLAKANSVAKYTISIATYGDLTNLTDRALSVSYNGTNFVFKIDEKSLIIGIEAFKRQYDLQSRTENILTTIDEVKTKIGVTKFKTDELTKAISIKKYGNLLIEIVKVDYETDYTFQIGEKDSITGLANLNTELNNQNDTNTETRYILNFISSNLNFNQTKSLEKAKKKKKKLISTSRYGDLLNNKIKVDYVGSDYTFQIDGKKAIEGLTNLNIQLNNQGDTTEDDYTIDNLHSTLTIDITKTVAKAKSKAKSIKTYGNLTSGTIKVDYETDYTFQVGTNSSITGLAKLNTELNNQNDANTETRYILNFISSNLNFDQTKSLDKANKTKNKKISISRYGNLLNDKIKVNYVGTNYTFQIDSKNLITSLGDLNKQLNFQGDTTIIDYTIDTLPLNLKIDETKTISRAKSIETYGDLRTQTINVSNDATTGAIKYTVKGNQKLNFDQLKAEAKNQGIILADGKNTEATLDRTQLTNLVTSELTKAKSIKAYGDLRTQTINVSNDATTGAIKYTVKGNQKLNFEKLSAQASNQGITLADGKNTEATLDRTQLTNLVTSELTKAKSIKAYGDLRTQTINVSNDATTGAIKYTVKGNQKLNFEKLSAQASNQGIILADGKNTEATLDRTQLTNLVTSELTKAKSIKAYGDLRTQTINVSNDATTGAIKYTVKGNQKLNFEKLSAQASNQGIILADGKNTEATLDRTQLTNLVTSELTKAKSIKAYGDLRTQTINVSNDATTGAIKYTVKGNQKLNFEKLSAQASNQGIILADGKNTEATLDRTQLTNLVTSELTKAKSIKAYGDLRTQTINVSNDATTGAIKYTVKGNQKLNFEKLSAQASNQGIILADGKNTEATLDRTQLTNLVTSELTKAKSIKAYGDLRTQTINVSNDATTGAIKYTVKGNQKLNFEKLSAQASNQGIILADGKNTEATLDRTQLTNLVTSELTKAKSIKAYGDLRTQTINVSNDATTGAIKYTVKGNQKLNFEKLSAQASNQGIILADGKNTEATLDRTQLTNLVTSELTKAKSIKAYGDLRTQTINVSNDATTGAIKYTVKGNQKLNFEKLKAEAKNQGIILADGKNTEATLDRTQLTNLVTSELTKAKSIKAYGDLRTQTINVSNDATTGAIKYTVKGNQKLNFEKLKAEAKNQGIILADGKNTEATLDRTQLTNLVTSELTKAKSIKAYGDLRTQTINVSNDATTGAIKYTVKGNQKLNFEKLKAEAKNQGIILADGKNTEATLDRTQLTNLVTSELTKAKSIKAYGDLRTQTINVSNDATTGAIKYTVKGNQKLNFEKLKAEAKNQGIILADGKNTEATLDRTQLTNLVTSELTKAKSIKAYGDLRTQTINVSNDATTGAIKYTVKGNQKLNFEKLKAEAKNQGIILADGKNTEATLDRTQLTNLVTSELTKAKSIKAYGDLRTQTINVSNDATTGAIKYTVKGNQKLNFEKLKAEAKNQGIILADGKNTEATLDRTQLTNLVTSELTKAKSIKAYGDLRTQTINVSNDATTGAIKYTVKGNQKLNFEKLKAEAKNQGIILADGKNTEATLDRTQLTNLVTSELTKAKSIKAYGDLRTQTINVSNDATTGAIKYTVKGNQKLNFEKLKAEASNQGIILADGKNTEATLDRTQLTNLVTSELTKAKSIKAYGDLRTQTINVSNDATTGAIKYTVKGNQKLNFEKLKAEASNQGIILADGKNTEATLDRTQLTNLVTSELTKAKSIKAYGDLRTQTINVSNDATTGAIKYTVKGNQKLNFEKLKAEASNQGIILADGKNTEATLDRTQLTNLVTSELTKAKSIKAYGDLRTQTINVSNDATTGAIKYTVKGNQKLNFEKLSAQASNQGIILADGKNTEATLDRTQLTNLVTSELTKAKSIKAYGDLRTQTINVSNDATTGAIKYTVKGNQKLNFEKLSAQASNQGIILADGKNTEATLDRTQLTNLVTSELTKAKSIKAYGDLRTQTINVSNDATTGAIKYTVKGNQKLNFEKLSAQASNQGIILADGKNTEATLDRTQLTNLVTSELTKAKSIKAYGDLRTQTINVSNDATTGAIKYTVKGNQKLNFEKLSAQASNQGIILADGKNTEATLDRTQLTNLVTSELTKAKSIKAYGDLRTQTINVSNDATTGAIKYTVKGNQKLNFEKLSAQASNQGIILADGKNTEATLDRTQLTNLVTSELTKAKSIKAYGDLRTQTINVSNDATTGAIKYTVKGNQKLNFEKLKAQASNQGIILADGKNTEATLDRTQLTNLVTSELTKAKSIKAYGDLRTQTINVSNDATTGAIKYTVKGNQKLNFEKLKAQASNQGIILADGKNTEATLDRTQLTNLVTSELTKAKSIKAYGDLRTQTINVSNDATTGAIKYTVKGNQKLNFEKLSAQASNQGITLADGKNTEATLDRTQLTNLVTSELTKAKSIKAYGDLRTQTINVSNDATTGAIKYTVKSNQELNFEKLSAQASNQGITLADGKNTEATLDATDLEGLKTNQLTTAKTKKTSIETYGDLTTQPISVSYNVTDGAIKYTVKSNQELNFEKLSAQASNQGITLADGKNTEATLDATDLEGLKTNQLTTAKTKKTSIETYGDLTDLDEIVVDYIETNYTFKVGSNSLITGLELFKTELENQGITTTINNIDDVVETIQGLTGALNTTNADAKKKTTSTTSDDQSGQGSKSNNLSIILPIVSGVILTIIIIGVLLKKYFKNKKSK